MSARVLFVGGTGRCGSTMLLRMLGMHEQIETIKQETNPPGRHPVDNWIETWCRLGDRSDGVRWIAEKSPQNAITHRALLSLIDGSRYLHIQRTLAPTVRSIMRFGSYPISIFGKPTCRHDAERVVTFVNSFAHESKKLFCDRMMIMHYERIIIDPQRELAAICEWLEIDPPNKRMREFPIRQDKLEEAKRYI